ncbi:hypothetical protein MUY73_11635, partial [Sphingomicrobium aestuariivivum]
MTNNKYDHDQESFWLRFGMLRGGRVTKIAGRDASYAPHQGVSVQSNGGIAAAITSAFATVAKVGMLPLLLASGATAAYAQRVPISVDTCSSTSTGKLVCSDTGAATGSPINWDSSADGHDTTIELEDGFEIISSTEGMVVRDDAAITITQGETSSVSSMKGALEVLQTSIGGVDISLSGSVHTDSYYYVAGTTVPNPNYNWYLCSLTGASFYCDTVITTNPGSTETSYQAVTVDNQGGDLLFSSTGSISSGTGSAASGGGLSITQSGGGLIDVDVNDVRSSGDSAIVVTRDGVGETYVDMNGTVTGGGGNGLEVVHNGSGNTWIRLGSDAQVTGGAGYGIVVTGSGGGATEVRGSSGDVTGATDGIYINQAGDITVADLDSVTGTTDDGIDVESTAGSVTITNVDTVTGADSGIEATAYGDVSIQGVGLVGGVNAGTGAGIDASSATGDVNIGGTSAIGDVTSTSSYGINAVADEGSVVVDSSMGSVSGTKGVVTSIQGLYSDPLAATTLITVDSVTGTSGEAIAALAGPYAFEITVNATGAVSGTTGILITNNGAGNTTIDLGAYASVEGRSGDGINITGSAQSATLIYGGGATVTGADHGIVVDKLGDVILTDIGNVTGTTNSAIQVETSLGTIRLTTSGDEVRGSGTAIFAQTYDGSTTIDTSSAHVISDGLAIAAYATSDVSITTADVTGTSTGGVTAQTSSDIDIDTRAGTISSNGYGIRSVTTGGSTQILAGAMTVGGDAIDATSTNGLTIDTTAGAISAGDDGVYARNNNNGNVSINAGDITATSGNGIDVRNRDGSVLVNSRNSVIDAGATGLLVYAANGTVTVDTLGGTVSGDFGGIAAFGYNGVRIDASDVSGGSSVGIDAVSRSYVTIDTTTGTVSGDRGIVVDAQGGLATVATGTVTATGDAIDVTGVVGATITTYFGTITAGGRGITVTNNADTVSVNSGLIYADTDGIYVVNTSGDVDITARTIEAGENGIFADTGAAVTIDTTLGSVSGGQNGIAASGDAGVTITTGDVTGSVFDGIDAKSSRSVSVDSTGGTVTAGTTGIRAEAGSGLATVYSGSINAGGNGIQVTSVDGATVNTQSGTITAGEHGISVTNDRGAVNVTAAGIDAGRDGVSVANGAGDVDVTATGAIEADWRGVYANTQQTATVDTSTGTVTGAMSGVVAFGVTGVNITTADVTGTVDWGVLAVSAGEMIIDTSAGTVTAGYNAVQANGSGGVDLTVGDLVAGSDGVHVDVNAAGDTVEITLEGEVLAGDDGVDVAVVDGRSVDIHLGSYADVKGYGDDGVTVSGVGASHSATVRGSSGSIYGADDGIYMNIAGDISIYDLDSVTGATGDGIDVTTTGGDITIDFDGVVDGGALGISAVSDGGVIDITASGSVTGGAGGISADISNTDLYPTGPIYGPIDMDVVSIDTFYASVDGGAGVGIDVDATSVRGLIVVRASDVTGASGIDISVTGTDSRTFLTVDHQDGTVTATGGHGIAVTTDGGSSFVGILTEGIDATGGDGIHVDVANYSDVDIWVEGDVSGSERGVYATADYGFIRVDTTNGTVSGANGAGIYTNNVGGAYVDTADVSGLTGVAVRSLGGEIQVDTSAGTVTGEQTGIEVRALYSPNTYKPFPAEDGGNIAITTGDVVANGNSISPTAGIRANNDATAGTIEITTLGAVSGEADSGIFVGQRSTNSVTLDVNGDVDADGTGIVVESEGSVAVDIATGATISSDADNALAFSGAGDVTVDNHGTILGEVTFGDGDDTLNNWSGNSVNLRNFADTDMDDVRDEEGVATSDFGAGDDTFNNGPDGVVNLVTVADETGFTAETSDDTDPVTWDTTGEYVVVAAENTGGTVHQSITEDGVEQAHLTSLETFVNSGSIVMQDSMTGGTEAVAGDVIVITGSDTAGVDGDGVFVSDGGSLYLDTVLNDGTGDITDTLVVDGTSVGAGGATTIYIESVAPGSGAGTDLDDNGMWDEGEGILLVSVLDAGASDAGAFELSTILYDNGYAYDLYFGTAGGDWYLANVAGASDVGFCDGDVTVSTGVIIDALGCQTDDSFTIEGDASANFIEGAGGSDTITVLGDADVVGGIYGGGDGQDDSAALDTGDNIFIDTTGMVGLVDGQLGDDTITIANGDVGMVYGNVGDDTLIVTGGLIDGLDGGDGNDTIAMSGGVIGTVDAGAGDDDVTLDGATVIGAITTGTGDDTVAMTDASAASLATGEGADSITLATTDIAGAITTGAGDDSLAMTGGSAGSIDTDGGMDSVTLVDADVTGAITTG